MGYFTFPHTRNYDGDVGWLIDKVKRLLECCDQMTAWKNAHEAEYLELRALYDQIINGNFPDSMIEALEMWMRENAGDLLSAMIPVITFTLNDAGYFVITYPDGLDALSWATTGLDIEIAGYDYGHLVLMY